MCAASTAPGADALAATWLGRVDYLAAWRLQEAVATRVRRGDPERLLLLEHAPVYTIGRRGTLAHLVASPAVLRAAGASVYRVDRGGDITYHGPGQLVGYPIVRLGEDGDLVGYVRAIEDGLGDALATYGITGRAEKGKTGVWVDLPDGRPAKIAAIGVRVSRGITTHGFALNVSTDLEAFARILPCGFTHEVASLARLHVAADVQQVADRCAEALAGRLGRALVVNAALAPARDDEIPADAPVRSATDLLERETVAV
ncbi:MAG: lipoyl(octanoyl) transferase [Chloroflexi bacterium 13_1_40CM_4_69_19]|nr:MAG: lipoyl(octanoyl) transferase [Chloroflexi bacterium 13_1_40CM_4_69_19]